VVVDDGAWVCEVCGGVVDMRRESAWHIEMGGKAGEPNVLLVIADGLEVHRCELPRAS
jgi:hypothetical protein